MLVVTRERLVNLYGSELIHEVTRGKVITLKHFLIGVGLHNITGLKTPVKILSHLGHSVDYNFVCETETAEAEKAQSFFLNDGTLQPLEPVTPEAVVLTYWWADNFNQKLESLTGHGVIDSTHIVKFFDWSDSTTLTICNVSIPRSRRRSLIPVQQIIPSICVDKKKEPPIIFNDLSVPVSNQISEEVDIFLALYVFWLVLWHLASSDQILPRFSGWCINMQNNLEPLKKTIVTYLPPLNSPITEFGTVYKLFETLQSQESKVNTPYVNITLDVGAAINAYKVLWNFLSKFKNIVIYLGDFHYIKEAFAVLGKIITGSGFEDIIYQSGICSVGSLNGVLAGSHYNRCWTVHTHLSEALERLLFQRFLTSVDAIPDALSENLQSHTADEEILNTLMNDEEIGAFLAKFEEYNDEVRKGNHEKTSQFWLVYYLDIMQNQHLLHTAIQTNNFYLRLHGLKTMLPYFFAMDKQNYAQYGSCYINTLEHLDITHPGCRQLLKYKGRREISLQSCHRSMGRTNH